MNAGDATGQELETVLYVPPNPEPDENMQHSLFGEILDWMLVPLLLLWPMSIAVTYLVAKSIANYPFDRALDDRRRIPRRAVREQTEPQRVGEGINHKHDINDKGRGQENQNMSGKAFAWGHGVYFRV